MRINILLIFLFGFLLLGRAEETSVDNTSSENSSSEQSGSVDNSGNDTPGDVSSSAGGNEEVPPQPPQPQVPTIPLLPFDMNETERQPYFFACASTQPYSCPHPLDHSGWYDRFKKVYLDCNFTEAIDVYEAGYNATEKVMVCYALAKAGLEVPTDPMYCIGGFKQILGGILQKFLASRPNLQCNRKCVDQLFRFTYTKMDEEFIECSEGTVPITNDILIPLNFKSMIKHPLIQAEGSLGKYAHYTLFTNGTVIVKGPQTGDFDIEFNLVRSPLFKLKKFIKHARIADGVNYLGSSLFYLQRELETVEIPSSVVYILNNTFYGCLKLKSVELPFNLQIIGMNPFYGCLALEKVTIQTGYTLNAMYKVEYMTNPCLTDAMIPGTQYINQGQGVLGQDGKPLVQQYCAIDNVLYSRDKKTLAFYPPGRKDATGEIAKEYSIPNTTKTISYAAFAWSKLEEIDIPDSVTFITACAFELSAKLKTLTIPYKVQSLQPAVGLFAISLIKVDILGEIFYVGRSVFTQDYALDDISYHGYNYPTGDSCDPTAWDSYTGLSPIKMNAFHHDKKELNFCGLKGTVDGTIPYVPAKLNDYYYRMCLFTARAATEGFLYKKMISSELATGGISLYDDLNLVKYYMTPAPQYCSPEDIIGVANVTGLPYITQVPIVTPDTLYLVGHHACCSNATLIATTLGKGSCQALIQWVGYSCPNMPEPPPGSESTPPTPSGSEQQPSTSSEQQPQPPTPESSSEPQPPTPQPPTSSESTEDSVNESESATQSDNTVTSQSKEETTVESSSEKETDSSSENVQSSEGKAEQPANPDAGATKRDTYDEDEDETTRIMKEMFEDANFDTEKLTANIAELFSDTNRHRFLDEEEEAQMHLPEQYNALGNNDDLSMLQEFNKLIKEMYPEGIQLDIDIWGKNDVEYVENDDE